MRISPLKMIGCLFIAAATTSLKADTSPREREWLKNKARMQQVDPHRYNKILEQAKSKKLWEQNQVWQDAFVKMQDSIKTDSFPNTILKVDKFLLKKLRK